MSDFLDFFKFGGWKLGIH